MRETAKQRQRERERLSGWVKVGPGKGSKGAQIFKASENEHSG